MRYPFPGLMFVTALVLAGCQSAPEEPVQVSPGHGLFLSHCVGCHQGAGNPPGPNDVVMQSPSLATEEAFIRFLRNPTAPLMPPFTEEQLSDHQAAELYLYLKTEVQP